MKIRNATCAMAVVLASGTALAGPGDTLEFEDLVPGTVYNNGSSFQTAGINFGQLVNIDVLDFTHSGGTTTNTGSATVVNPNQAGAGNGISMGNVNLDFDFGGPQTTVSFQYAEFGGNVNLTVNGTLLNFEDYISMDGMNAGGAMVSVSEDMPGSNSGSVTVVGNITQFSTGGQELNIDDVRFVPAPGAVALLGLGGVTLLRRRR